MNKETKQKLIKDFNDVVHVIGGTLAGLISAWYPAPSIAAMVFFGVFEYFQGKKIGDAWVHDLWGAVLGYFIGLGIVLVLKLVGII